MVEEFFNGHYEVEKFLGEGSFAEVYLVKHKFLDDLRAIKIIKEPLKSSSNTKEVFQEVRLATQLRHENIISIYDAGVISTYGLRNDGNFNLACADETKKDDWAYFIMEYVQGGDLEQYLSSFINSNIPMPIYRVLDIVKQILLGLDTLHSAKPAIVHRDLKLNNILLSYNSHGKLVIKISDFGFAKEVTTNSLDVEVAGSKYYMAPECFNKVSSTMSDIYAVGVMFYQLLTNHCPYAINKYDLFEILELKPWKNQLVAPSEYRPEIPSYIDEIIMKALSFNPEDRYKNAGDFLVDVEKVIERYPITENPNFSPIEEDSYSEYIINDSIKRAFELAKCENGLNEAIEILESEVLQDYDVRKCYQNTLRIWKSKRPDVKLVSQAFSVNLRGSNYNLACNFLKEAIAYNPDIKNKYQPYIDLWNVFYDLGRYGILVRAVRDLEDLMDKHKIIYNDYIRVINTLKTYSIDEILNEALRLADSNSLVDASRLMEFAVVADRDVRAKYAYKLSLLKQNMEMEFKANQQPKNNTIDFAIDLGTTDSIVSYYNGGNPIIIPNYKTGLDFTPSAVYIDDDNCVCVGQVARDALIENSKDAVSEFKNNMGFSIPFKFEKSSRRMFPEDLSAEVLKDLRKSVYMHCGVNLEDVVICVPANSNPKKTKAVNDAAELAGFRSHNLILEPIAVALAYKQIISDDGIWMIYDLGGGTFNVSLVKIKGNDIEKIATAGLENVGGNLFDWKIVEDILAPKIRKDLELYEFKKDNLRYSEEFSKLKNAAEDAKKELADLNKVNICIENFIGNYNFRYALTREELAQTVDPLIENTLNLCSELLFENSVDEADISKIILVGGSSLSPIVQDKIKEKFNCELEKGIDPLTVVSRGAAIYAGSLDKPSHEITQGKFSLLLKPQRYGFSGRVFNLDKKFSFLGYEIEFENDQFSFGKIPLEVDGSFNVNLDISGSYNINIFDRNGNLVEIDEKSPCLIKEGKFYVRFLDKYYDFNHVNLKYKEVLAKFNSLIRSLDENIIINQDNVVEYLEMVVGISRKDYRAIKLATIYFDYLDGIVDMAQNELDFVLLLENIENKVNILERIIYKRAINKLDEFASLIYELDEVRVNKNLVKLKEIYVKLIEIYVSINREEVIRACFFNLRYAGVYTSNPSQAHDLIRKALIAINLNDYDELLDIVNELYALDEREL